MRSNAEIDYESDQLRLIRTRKEVRSTRLLAPDLVKAAFIQSFKMLNPITMARNPVMFVTELGAILTSIVFAQEIVTGAPSLSYTFLVTVILWVTVLFANFAEALAEARGKAQANSLKQTRKSTIARRILSDGVVEDISSDQLQLGDCVLVKAGEIIPSDGEVIEGSATVDESAITGESAPVVREAGGDHSGVTGGTMVLSDQIQVQITSRSGDSFLDRMIALVEGAQRQKTPNELALTVTLAGLTLAFLIVTVSLGPAASFFGVTIPIPTLVALLVCLIPTTIGALLAAIGLAGMDRALAANVLAKSGKAVELAGDIDTLLLDKTGTITIGNRAAQEFLPLPGITVERLTRTATLASLGDLTPEGKSIVALGQKNLGEKGMQLPNTAELIPFSATSRLSGVDLPGQRKLRKGAPDAILKFAGKNHMEDQSDLRTLVERVGKNGGTPVVVCENHEILGVIALTDVLKPGISGRLKRLRAMGIKIVMITGDNLLTAAAIAKEAGVDDFVAEAKPDDKLIYIKKEQEQGRLVAMMGDGTNDAPALAQADLGVAMNSGTQAAKEAGNMVDLDSDPTKLIEIVEIGKQLLMTRGALTTFSIANDVAKYFAIIPAMFMLTIPVLAQLNSMGLASPDSAILSAIIFNAIVIPLLIPIAIKGVKYSPTSANILLRKNLTIYGLGGIIVPFVGIKVIDVIVSFLGLV